MTPDEVAKLAIKALDDWDHTLPEDREFLIRFAAIVEAKYREGLLAGAGEPVAEVYRHGKDSAGREWHGIHWYDPNVDTPSGTKIYTADQVAAAVLRETERCSAICDEAAMEESDDHAMRALESCGRLIRDRENT